MAKKQELLDELAAATGTPVDELPVSIDNTAAEISDALTDATAATVEARDPNPQPGIVFYRDDKGDVYSVPEETWTALYAPRGYTPIHNKEQ